MGKLKEIELPSYDDIFNSTKPEDIVEEKVVRLPINNIVPFPNHPFKVKDSDLEDMIESVRKIGVSIPGIVRKKDDGSYELISGHRRKRICEILDINTLPCIIRNLTDDEATILMVDSNIQREKVLPSEKAFAYKMKLEALNHQGKRTDLTSCQVGTKLNSAEKIAEDNDESVRQVYRYIRLTKLIPELLEMVDEERIALTIAENLSYLKEEEQRMLLDFIECMLATPNSKQAVELKKLSQNGEFTVEKMDEIMLEQKGNQKEKYQVTYDKFEKYIPRNVVTPKEFEIHLLKCAIACKKYGINLDDIQIDSGVTKPKKVERER